MHVPPPFVALGAAFAQRLLTREAAPPTPARVVLAVTTGLASAGLAASALGQFHRSGTTVDPVHPSRASALVTTGVNSVTRNPMYVGMGGLLLAHFIVRGSWRAVLPLAGFVLVIDRLQIAQEEDALLARFGADYEAYRAAVPRWLGPVRRR